MGTRYAATRWPVWALIREARRRAGLTQAALAAKAGTSQPTVAKYERGRALPDVATLSRLIEACGFELRMELAPATRAAATEGDAEERIVRNCEHARLISSLRHG